MHLSEDKRGIALVLIPALFGWAQIVVVIVAHLFAADAASFIGFGFACLFVLGMAILVRSDAIALGLEGGSAFAFVFIFFLLGYPVHMRTRGKHGGALGGLAGLLAMALMILPFVVLPLGAQVLAKRVAASESSRPPVPALVVTAPSDAGAGATAVDDDQDSAVCDHFDCKVGVLGDKAKATLAAAGRAGHSVQMNWATPERLAPLATLPEVDRLALYAPSPRNGRPYLTDLATVAKLTQLEQLTVWDNEIVDFTSLGSMAHLEQLTVHNASKLTSLRGLPELVNLKEVVLSLHHVKDLGPLGDLAHLQTATLHFGQHLDLAPLAKLTSLRKLELSFFTAADLTPVGTLTDLRQLLVSGSGYANLDALAKLTKIEYLNLWANVSAMPFVAPMKELTHLDADNNKALKDLTPLRGLQKLTSIELNNTAVEDIAPLATCTHLRAISLRKTHVKTLAPLVALNELVTLNLAGIPGLDIQPIAALPALKNVTLTEGQIPDAALKAFTAAAPKVKLSFSKP